MKIECVLQAGSHQNLLVNKSHPCSYFSQLSFTLFLSSNMNWQIAHWYLGMPEKEKKRNTFLKDHKINSGT